MEFARFRVLRESPTGEFMDPVGDESAEEGEIFGDADPAIPDG